MCFGDGLGRLYDGRNLPRQFTKTKNPMRVSEVSLPRNRSVVSA
jgi:hypothetical protein